MPLIDLKTNLRDLKFGRDRINGGSSNQPYITSPIPDLDKESGEFGFLNQDFILRGGSKAVVNSTTDVERLGRYFTDVKNPSGLLFVAKQNLLSRTAVRTQASGKLVNEGVYTPISTLTQAGGVAFGLHVNKQGLNPFDGLGSLRTYTDTINPELGDVFSIKSIDKNRLVNLFGAKILSNKGISDTIFLKDDISSNPQSLLSYKGGPDSILGIGSTQIKLKHPTVKNSYDNQLTDPTINYLTYSVKSLNTATVATTVETAQELGITGIEVATKKYELDNYRNAKSYIPALHQLDFRRDLIEIIKNNNNGVTTLMSGAPSYNPVNNKTLEQRVHLGDPGNASGKNLTSYTSGFISGSASNNSYDTINSSKIGSEPQNDLVKFRIGVINNNNPSEVTNIQFRAFLNQISDGYSSDWASTRYIGRGENFYTYNGFDRKVSLSWTVAAQSKRELIPMYKKLNYLASICAPDYSGHGYMRGNIVKLTVGGYFFEQPGIITGLSYEMNDDNATWEIGINDEGGDDSSVKELPHLIKVSSFNFIPIHTFVPRLVQNINKGTKERYIALAATTSNYDD